MVVCPGKEKEEPTTIRRAALKAWNPNSGFVKNHQNENVVQGRRAFLHPH